MTTHKEMAAIAGCHPSTIGRRLKNKWPQDRVLEPPRRNESKWLERTRALVFRTDFDTYGEVAAYAKENNFTLCEAIRHLVEFGLEEVKIERGTKVWSSKR